MLSYTITIKSAFRTEETNTDKDWVSSTNMVVHPVMGQRRAGCRLVRFADLVEGATFLAVVPDHPGLVWLLLHPPVSASQRAF